MRAYFSLRYSRTTETSSASRLNRHLFHLEDGLEQEARDASMRLAMNASLREARGEFPMDYSFGNANQYADKEKSVMQYAYDADEEAENWWVQQGKILIGSLSGRDRARM